MNRIIKDSRYFVLSNFYAHDSFLEKVFEDQSFSTTSDIQKAKRFSTSGDAYSFAHNNHLIEYKYPVEIYEQYSIIE